MHKELSYKSAVILGNRSQGLGILRSVTGSGYKTIVINDKTFSPSRVSRFKDKYIKLPKGLYTNFNDEAKEYLLNILLNLNVKYPSVLFPINEDQIKFIYDNKMKLREKYFIPENDIISLIDKFKFINSVPKELRIDTRLISEIEFGNPDFSNYIIKGQIGNKLRNITGRKAIKVSEVDENKKQLLSGHFENDELIGQKIIKTKEGIYSNCSFSVDGEIKSNFQYEKIGNYPNDFGSGSLLKSIKNSQLFEYSSKILKNFRYTGIAEIEYIKDSETGGLKVIEINPRTWKSVNFASDCGVNLVKDFLCFVDQSDIIKNGTYETNKYWIDLFAEIPRILKSRNPIKFNIRQTYECTWSKNDIMPFIYSIIFAPFIYLEI